MNFEKIKKPYLESYPKYDIITWCYKFQIIVIFKQMIIINLESLFKIFVIQFNWKKVNFQNFFKRMLIHEMNIQVETSGITMLYKEKLMTSVES